MQHHVGASADATLIVEEGDLATVLGSGDVPVLGTPRLIALCEAATVAVVQPLLGPGQTTVGTVVEFRHLAPSRLGASVEAAAKLEKVDGARLGFAVEAKQGDIAVGTGRIERVVVDRDRFLEGVE